MLYVMKFGGSSVADPECVRRSARRIADVYRSGAAVVAVLSAQGDTTDELLERAALYSLTPDARELDMLLSTGEQASAALMAMTLGTMGLPVVSLTGWQAGMETDGVHGSAHIRRIHLSRLRRELNGQKIVIAAGFQGISPGRDITTLGRGGSDTSAVALAAALGADACKIFTDVDGVCTADPRLVPAARKLDTVDTGEMRLLASLGSQVLHERAVALAARYHVPLEVLSSLIERPGTRIRPLPLDEGAWRCTALTRHGDRVSLVGGGLSHIEGLVRRATDALTAAGLNIYSVESDDRRLTVQTEEARTLDALRCLHREFFE